MASYAATGYASVIYAGSIVYTAGYGSTSISPSDGGAFYYRDIRFIVFITSTASDPLQLEVQADTVNTFDSFDLQTFTGSGSPWDNSIANGTVNKFTTYYWRARTGDGTNWSAWTGTRSLVVSPVPLVVYQFENVGVGPVAMDLTDDGYLYYFENVGVAPQPINITSNSTSYQYENVQNASTSGNSKLPPTFN